MPKKDDAEVVNDNVEPKEEAAAEKPKHKLMLTGVPYVPDGDYYRLEEDHPGTIDWLKDNVPDVYEGLLAKVKDFESGGLEPTEEDKELEALRKESAKAQAAAASAKAKAEAAERKRRAEEQKALLKGQIAGANADTERINKAIKLGINP